jgi:hypothetical protein
VAQAFPHHLSPKYRSCWLFDLAGTSAGYEDPLKLEDAAAIYARPLEVEVARLGLDTSVIEP